MAMASRLLYISCEPGVQTAGSGSDAWARAEALARHALGAALNDQPEALSSLDVAFDDIEAASALLRERATSCAFVDAAVAMLDDLRLGRAQ